MFEGAEFHHLIQVTHNRVGNKVLLNSGQGLMAEAEITEIRKKQARLQLISKTKHDLHSAPFAIAFSLLRNNHDSLIVEKCTELGARAFFPFTSEFSVRKPGPNTRARFELNALSAIKQCDNPWLPEVDEVRCLSGALESIREQGYTVILCSERRPERWLHHLGLPNTGKPCFLIGPEGGWGQDDYRYLNSIDEISIGDLVTRAETAAISIAAQWLAYANQFSTRGTT